MRPRASDMTTLTEDLRTGRVQTIVGWLNELHSALPAHAAGAVIGSVNQWQQWATKPTWDGAPLSWEAHRAEVLSALRAQGRRWRLLLTGQVDPLDQLAADDYVDAAKFLVGRLRLIAQGLMAQFWPWIIGLTAAMVAAVVGSLALLSSPAAKGIGVAISVFGWLGIAGRSLSLGLQQTVGHVEESLWQSELDLAAAWANTTLPDAVADRALAEAAAPQMPLRHVTSRLTRHRARQA
jgi:hypothetical protein